MSLVIRRVNRTELLELRQELEAKFDANEYLPVHLEGATYRDLKEIANYVNFTPEDGKIYDELIDIEFLLGES